MAVYYDYAKKYLAGEIPYSDYNIEYPPGAFILFTIPILFAKSIVGYQIAFASMVSVFILLGGYLLYKKENSNPLFLFSIFLFFCRPQHILQRFDIIVGVLIILSVIAFIKNKNYISFSALGVATAIKFFPIIILPFYLAKTSFLKTRIKNMAIFSLVIVLIVSPFMFKLYMTNKLDGLTYFWNYHKSRGIQVESTWSSLAILLSPSRENLKSNLSFGAWNIESSLTPVFTKLAFYILSLTLIFYLFTVNLIKSIDRKDMHIICFIVIGSFIFLNKVFSPQFVLWLVPIFPLVVDSFSFRKKITLLTFFVIFLATTYLIVGKYYNNLLDFEPLATTNLLARNVLLFVIVYGIFKTFVTEIKNRQK